MGLRLVQGVSLKEFEERFGERAQDVIPVSWSGWRRREPPFFQTAGSG